MSPPASTYSLRPYTATGAQSPVSREEARSDGTDSAQLTGPRWSHATRRRPSQSRATRRAQQSPKPVATASSSATLCLRSALVRLSTTRARLVPQDVFLHSPRVVRFYRGLDFLDVAVGGRHDRVTALTPDGSAVSTDDRRPHNGVLERWTLCRLSRG